MEFFDFKSFEGLYGFTLIREGYFHVPENVIRDIKKDFSDIIRFKDDDVPIKNYKLDFSGTSYEFLNQLEPKPSVDVKFTNKAFVRGSFHVIDSFKLKNNNATIQIDLREDTPERILSDVIEHEVSHFVQIMIKKYNEEKKGYGSMGGMPSKKLLKGLSLNKSKIKDHTKIPTEIYPDLLSSIRELQRIYSNQNELKIGKKEFFLNFLKSLNEKKPIGKIAPYVLKDIKDLSQPLYNHILKKMYVAFVK